MKKSGKEYGRTVTKKSVEGFSEDEKAAMKERARELKLSRNRGSKTDKKEAEAEVLKKITEMPEPDRTMARKIHAIICDSGLGLAPRTWYGMPAYAKKGDIICFFQNSQKFKTRYSTLGFSDKAALDDGSMWPNSYALKELTVVEEEMIKRLLKKAVQG